MRIVLPVQDETERDAPVEEDAHWLTIGRLNSIMAQRLDCGACNHVSDENRVHCSSGCPRLESCQSRVE